MKLPPFDLQDGESITFALRGDVAHVELRNHWLGAYATVTLKNDLVSMNPQAAADIIRSDTDKVIEGLVQEGKAGK